MEAGNDDNVKRALKHLRKKGWVSLRQFSNILGVSYPTILKYRNKKMFRYSWVGHTCRIYGDEVRRILSDGMGIKSNNVIRVGGERIDLNVRSGCLPIVERILTERTLERLDDFEGEGD